MIHSISRLTRRKVLLGIGVPNLKLAIDPDQGRPARRDQACPEAPGASNEDLTNEEIIFGYRGRHHVERAFRDMKDPYFINFSPPRHWTDQMLRVHAFYCVLALTHVSLLHRRVYQAGIEISQLRLLEELKNIKEITNYYPAQRAERHHLGGRPRSERTLTRLNSQQSKIFRVLGLERFVAS